MNLIERVRDRFYRNKVPASVLNATAPEKIKTSYDYISERKGFSEPFDISGIKYKRDSTPINFIYSINNYQGQPWRVSASLPYKHLLKLMHRMDDGKTVHFAKPIHFRGDRFVISTGGCGFWDIPANYAILAILAEHSESEQPHIETVIKRRMEDFFSSMELIGQKKTIDSKLKKLDESFAQA